MELGGNQGIRLVGRDDEVHLIATAAAELPAARSGRLFIVSGEAGIGKTALGRAVLDAVAAGDMRTVERACWPGGAAPPMWLWTEVLSDLGVTVQLEALPSDRFARYAALLGLLEQACRKDPPVILMDDLHLADRETLLFTRYLARSLSRVPAVLIATWRGVGLPVDDVAAGLWREATTTVALGPLDQSGIRSFLDGYPALSRRQRERCEELSGGNPLFLHEAARAPDLADGQVPLTTQQVIGEQLDSLSSAGRALLASAAILGPPALVAEVAEVTGCSTAEVVDIGATTNGLAEVANNHVVFRHEIVRQVVVETTPFEVALDVHRSLVAMLTPPAGLTAACRRATHSVLAAPGSEADVDSAVEACREAARRLVDAREFQQAANMLLLACSAFDSQPHLSPSPALVVEHAEAVLAAGHLAEARERFATAVDAAEGTNELQLLARAVLGMGGVWVEEQRGALERDRLLGLLRRCLADLSVADAVLKARLTVRLRAEQVYQGQASPGDVSLAVDAVRMLGDDDALAEALSLYHHTLLTPAFAHMRLKVADELVAVAARNGDALRGLIGQCWRTVDLYLLGDPEADRVMAGFREHAGALGCRSIEYIVSVLDAMRVFCRGRLEEAEELSGAAMVMGEEVGDADALAYYGGQLVAIRWAQGRLDEIRPMVEDLADSPTLKSLDKVFPAVCAAAAAIENDAVAADRWLDRVGPGALASIPLYSTWLTTMSALTETAWCLDDQGLAEEVLPLLEPYADLPVRASLAVTCLGPTTRLLGLLKATLASHDEAVTHLRTALSECRRLANRPVSAIIAAELAEVLMRRHGSGDQGEAAALLRLAIDEATEMGLTGRIGPWQSLLEKASTDPDVTTPSVTADKECERSLVRVTDGWELTAGGSPIRLASSVGLAHLAVLLANPDRPISAIDLSTNGSGSNPEVWRGDPLIDDQARSQYRERLSDLRSDIVEAEANRDTERASLLRAEYDGLVSHLAEATGLAGRPRRVSDAQERARMRVSRALRRALARIGEVDSTLGYELQSSIRTGLHCEYRPDPARPSVWTVDFGS